MLRVAAVLVATALAWSAEPAAAAPPARARKLHRRPHRIVPRPRRPIQVRPPARRTPGRFLSRAVAGRELTIYLPPGYDGSLDRYRLLILQDGQNLFGDGDRSWQVHRAIDAEVLAGRAEPVIVVGVPAAPSHRGRVAEYAVNRDPDEDLGGAGAGYIGFVADELVPWLRRELRIRPGRDSVTIGGSSMGARIALEAYLTRPDVFGNVLAHSPSVWFNRRELLARFASGDLPEGQIYLDSGGSGTSRDDADNVARLRDLLLSRSFEHGAWDAPGRRAPRRLWHWLEPGHQHNESAWRERFPRALRALYPPR